MQAGINDAVKRIDVMISMWLEGKFSKELKRDVFNLSEGKGIRYIKYIFY